MGTHKDLDVWKLSIDLVEDIYQATKSFPKAEQYGLTSQIRRAADSIALNISEGSIGQTNPEFKRFISYAIRSLAEMVACLHKANRREYISEQEFSKYYEYAFNLMNMLVGFKNKIK